MKNIKNISKNTNEKNNSDDFILINLIQKLSSKIEPFTKLKIKIKKNHKINVIILVLKKKLQLKPEQALFLFYKKKVLNPSLNIEEFVTKFELEQKEINISFSEMKSFGYYLKD